jgi:hypothetical protein
VEVTGGESSRNHTAEEQVRLGRLRIGQERGLEPGERPGGLVERAHAGGERTMVPCGVQPDVPGDDSPDQFVERGVGIRVGQVLGAREDAGEGCAGGFEGWVRERGECYAVDGPDSGGFGVVEAGHKVRGGD